MSTTKVPHVAVIGAGPGGLTLISLLEQRKIPVKLSVFEADAFVDARLDQGGSLDLKVSHSKAQNTYE